jgi:hypothetical protein
MVSHDLSILKKSRILLPSTRHPRQPKPYRFYPPEAMRKVSPYATDSKTIYSPGLYLASLRSSQMQVLPA